VKGITFLDGLLRWKQSRVYVPKGKVAHESHARSAWCAHGGTPWWEVDKKVVGENFLLTWNEGRHKTLRPHVCEVLKYQVGTQEKVQAI